MRKYSAWCRKCDEPALIGLTTMRIHDSGGVTVLSDEEHLSESVDEQLKVITIECRNCLSSMKLDVEDVEEVQ